MEITYVAPKLVELGTVRELTLGDADGNVTDQTFPANTPKDQLTFS